MLWDGNVQERCCLRPAPKVRYLVGDVRKVIRKIPDKSVQCVVTSPPYFNLRNYETDPLIWGGDSDCDHEWGDEIEGSRYRRTHIGGSTGADKEGAGRDTAYAHPKGRFYSKCKAWLGSLGNEPTIDLYVSHIVEISNEIYRVLRDDGVYWLNLGDSYDENNGLVGMPWLVAFALRDSGWNVKSESIVNWIIEDVIIWEKPNPTPESTSNRPARSHENIFMLTKGNTTQFWVNFRRGKSTRVKPEPEYIYIQRDTDEEREDIPNDPENWKRTNLWVGHKHYFDMDAVRKAFKSDDTSPRKTSTIPNSTRSDRHQGQEFFGNPVGRNLRTVWTIPVAKYPGAHYAVFSKDLIEDPIRSSSSHRACPHCGAPWIRRIERDEEYRSYSAMAGNFENEGKWKAENAPNKSMYVSEDRDVRWGPVSITKTVGWIPTCDCPDNDGSGRSMILDPFGGSGTTGVVAYNLGRDCILIDLKKEYAKMAVERLKKEGDYKTGLGEFE